MHPPKTRTARLGLAALALAATAATTGPAHAAWQTFTYKDLGVAKEFPSAPKIEKGVYTTPMVKNAPKTTFTVEKDGNTLRMTVVDLKGREADGANILGEAISAEVAGRGTTYKLSDMQLYDKGFNSVFGTVLMIDKPDGTRLITNSFFNKGRLYLIEAVVPPTSQAKASPDFGRFINTIQFHLAGYGFDFKTGHDFPIGDDDPNDRDTHFNANYKPPAGYENVGKVAADDVKPADAAKIGK
jgi:hypothetical protein